MSTASSETRIGFLTIDWKLNASAVIALILAITSLYYQLRGYWTGAVVTLLPADKLYVIGDSKRFRIATRMVYTNDGAEKYGAIVLREKASIQLGNRTMEQWAEMRGRLDVVVNPDGTRMATLLEGIDAAPFLVPSAKLVSHEVLFAPREYGDAKRTLLDFARKQVVVNLLREYAKTHDTLAIVFEARVREVAGRAAGEERTLTTTCLVSLDQGLIDKLEADNWTARTCQGFAASME